MLDIPEEMVFHETHEGAVGVPSPRKPSDPIVDPGAFCCPQELPVSIMATEQINSLVTATDAACLAGVAAATIRTWVDRGVLPVADVDSRGRNLFRLIDVVKAERATRGRARRTYQTSVA